MSERKSSWRDRLTIVLAVVLGAYFILLLLVRYALPEYEPMQADREWTAVLKTTAYVTFGAVLLKYLRRWIGKKDIPLKDGSLCLILAYP